MNNSVYRLKFQQHISELVNYSVFQKE